MDMVEQNSDQISSGRMHEDDDNLSDDEFKVLLTKDEIDKIRIPWTSSLIIKLYGKGFRYQNFISKLKAAWGLTGEMKCITLGCGFFLINFNQEEDLIRVSNKAFWFIGDNNVISVRKWEPNFKPSNADHFTSAPIWVKLPELPIEYYDQMVLNKIGSKIGVVLHIDSKTSACEQYGEFARMCIQLDLQKPLPKSIKIGSFEQLVQYEGTNNPTCPEIIGHMAETCQRTDKQNEILLTMLPSTSAPRDDESNVEMVETQPTSSLSQTLSSLLVSQGTRKWKYEVFVSFRGVDTRKGFCAHLFCSLEQAELCHYRDTDQGERGSEVKKMLFSAIQQSKNAVIVFSPNYADSKWCLDELVEIMNLNENYNAHGHKVLPIFYNVEPSEVRGLKGDFGEGFWKCIEKNKYNHKEEEWKRALNQAGSKSGWDSMNEDEPSLIKKIVNAIICNRVLLDQSPYGGNQGDFYDDNIYTGIRKMTIVVVASMIESINIEYDQHGSLVHSRRYGGARVGETTTVRLNRPKEHVIAILGHIKGTGMDAVIQSLVIRSNERDYGPYGMEHGTPFSIHANKDENIVGFFGKCGSHLSSIGAHCKPISYPETIGPFGSQRVFNWDHGKHQDVRQVKVTFDSRIRSISVLYDNFGHSVGPFSHPCGLQRGAKSETIDLEYPYEYITSIWGYTCENSGMAILQSLTIHTNKKSYGPYGTEVGNQFSNKQQGVKVVGFKGRYSNNNLESIGANVEPISDIYPHRSIGPFGGEGGNPWDDGKRAKIRQIVVKWYTFIESVCFTYENEDGMHEELRHGGDDDNERYELKKSVVLNLDPDEYVTRMSGYFDRGATGDNIVRSLTFESNKRKYGPYGNEEGVYFLSPPNLGKIVGFHGRSSSEYLVSIGAYFESIFHIHPLKTIGPFGSDDLGDSWDDGRSTGLRQIEIRSVGIIDAIRCVYDDSGVSLICPQHGGFGGQLHMISLDYPDEYIISMSGYIGRYDGVPILVSSLTFRTNYDNKYGPFGDEEGVPFSFGSNIGKIVGFYGRSGMFLNSIGAYVDILN